MMTTNHSAMPIPKLSQGGGGGGGKTNWGVKHKKEILGF